MHCHIRAEVPDAHHNFPESVYKLPQRFTLLLADADQCDGCQVVQPTGRKLDVELRHQCLEAVDRVEQDALMSPNPSGKLEDLGAGCVCCLVV